MRRKKIYQTINARVIEIPCLNNGMTYKVRTTGLSRKIIVFDSTDSYLFDDIEIGDKVKITIYGHNSNGSEIKQWK